MPEGREKTVQVLVIDANSDSADLLAARLKPHGFAIRRVAAPRDAGSCDGYAVVLADCDGFAATPAALVEALRGSGLRQPLAVLSSSADWRERIEALDAGCDDFIVKPIRSEEVAARLRALVRRASGSASDQIVSGDLRLDLRLRCAWRGTRCLDLTRSEFRLLSMLMRQPDHVLDYVSIGQAIHPDKSSPSQNAIEVLVARLRRKVGHDRIRTIRGIGYRFDQAPPATGDATCMEGCARNCGATPGERFEELDPLCYI